MPGRALGLRRILARMATRVHIDHGAVVRVVGHMSHEATKKAANKTQERARLNIAAAGRIDTGEMRRKIRVVDHTVMPMRPTFQVEAHTKQAVYNEFGTRAHGPVHAKFLVFRPKGSRGLVFARRVRGITAIHFMRRARDQARPFDYT